MLDATVTGVRESTRLKSMALRVRVEAPTMVEWSASLLTATLLILAFPDFDLVPLAWLSLVPLLLAITARPHPLRGFLLGWIAGTVFFYGSCHWLTYSMIHYGNLPAAVAYVLLVPAAAVVGLFPGFFAALLAFSIRSWGTRAVVLSPFIWTACEWLRLEITGQLWNAIGYSLAFHPAFIQPARWGGVYLVGFFVVLINCVCAFALIQRNFTSVLAVVLAVATVGAIMLVVSKQAANTETTTYLHVVAVQPNVPMTLIKSDDEMSALVTRHLTMTTDALDKVPDDGLPRLVIWPESPMNFTYATDSQFQLLLRQFAVDNHTSVLLNSLEPAPDAGGYNSALLINEEGRLISQYDKIRLLPFGEYVPLPHWLPGASLITAIVGDFTPGEHYTLMPIAKHHAGVFICIESAYPSIARTFSKDGADFLINISNDGYLGPTAVMRQHLANAVFRAVENGKPLLRVTNSGISGFIDASGSVRDETPSFRPATRTWSVYAVSSKTFYSNYGDIVAYSCVALTAVIVLSGVLRFRKGLQF
ncbi:MAG: apolipoprotein N-acyltransferase [Pyrinomonadaceae bacterium]